MKPIDKEKYYQNFDGNDKDKQFGRYESALTCALDIRKFEIDMYWKRATYFWTFIGVIFAGYFLLIKETNVNYLNLFFVNCLGFVFSFCWYLVNKGSKFWQSNWEKQVDMLEERVHGPLYKTVIYEREQNLLCPSKSYPYSVSKINQYLSLFVVLIWIVLGLKTFAGFMFYVYEWRWIPFFEHRAAVAFGALGLFTIIFSWRIFEKARTGFMDDAEKESNSKMEFSKAGLRNLPLE